MKALVLSLFAAVLLALPAEATGVKVVAVRQHFVQPVIVQQAFVQPYVQQAAFVQPVYQSFAAQPYVQQFAVQHFAQPVVASFAVQKVFAVRQQAIVVQRVQVQQVNVRVRSSFFRR